MSRRSAAAIFVIAWPRLLIGCATTGATPAAASRRRMRRPRPPRRPRACPGARRRQPAPSGGPTGGPMRLRRRRHGPVLARHAVPQRRQRSGGVRLQRVRRLRVRAERRRGAADRERSVPRGTAGAGTRSSSRATWCFSRTVSPGASHVGIAIGGDEFVHAPSSAGEVRVERMSASYWSTRFVGARRVL